MHTYKLRIPSLSTKWFEVNARYPWEAFEEVQWRIKLHAGKSRSADYSQCNLWEMVRIKFNGKPDNTPIWTIEENA